MKKRQFLHNKKNVRKPREYKRQAQSDRNTKFAGAELSSARTNRKMRKILKKTDEKKIDTNLENVAYCG